MSAPSRVHIACARCKARKVRCDGSTPTCGRCEANGTDCEYAAARQYRGIGRKSKRPPAASHSLDTPEPSVQAPGRPHAEPPDDTPHSFIPVSSLSAAVASITAAQGRGRPAAGSIFPAFLLPGAYEMHLAGISMSIDCAKTGTDHKAAPLMPIEITKRLLRNAWDGIRPQLPFLESMAASDLQSAVASQYADSCLGPGSRPDRWALVNAVVAVAVHYKTAAGAGPRIAGIAAAYFDNAMAVLPQLMQMQTPPLFGPALQAMEAYASATGRAPVSRMLSAILQSQVPL